MPLPLPLVLLSLGPFLPPHGYPSPCVQPRPQTMPKALHHDMQSLEQLLLQGTMLVKGDRQSLHLSTQPFLNARLALHHHRLCLQGLRQLHSHAPGDLRPRHLHSPRPHPLTPTPGTGVHPLPPIAMDPHPPLSPPEPVSHSGEPP